MIKVCSTKYLSRNTLFDSLSCPKSKFSTRKHDRSVKKIHSLRWDSHTSGHEFRRHDAAMGQLTSNCPLPLLVLPSFARPTLFFRLKSRPTLRTPSRHGQNLFLMTAHRWHLYSRAKIWDFTWENGMLCTSNKNARTTRKISKLPLDHRKIRN